MRVATTNVGSIGWGVLTFIGYTQNNSFLPLGKCTGNAPCACTENQCVFPSFVKSKTAEKLR